MSVWMDSYAELDELMKLYRATKITLEECNARLSEIEEQMKAARREMDDLLKKAKAEKPE